MRLDEKGALATAAVPRIVGPLSLSGIPQRKIGEHWDALQTIPKKPANQNTMF